MFNDNLSIIFLFFNEVDGEFGIKVIFIES